MKRSTALYLIFFCFSLHLASFGTESVVCRGGDGPHPFLNITSQFSSYLTPVATQSSVRDFLYWQDKQAVVYSNDRGEVLEKQLMTGKERYIADLDERMSRVTDPGESMILTDHSWYIDSTKAGASWHKFNDTQYVKHLYWHRQGTPFSPTLYSISDAVQTSGIQKINLLSYRVGHSDPSDCALPVEPGEVYRVGEGHYYPYVFLYKVRNEGGVSTVSLYEMQVTDIVMGGYRCDIHFVKTLSEALPGRVTKVYQFSDRKTFLATYETDSGNEIYWESPTKRLICEYGEAIPMVPNPRVPAVFSWQSSKGIKLLLPAQEAEATILPNLSPCSMKKEDFWLTDNGERLIVRANQFAERRLFLYNLK